MPKSTTEEHEQRTETLCQALIQGEKSGVAGPLDMDKIKRQARADLRFSEPPRQGQDPG